MLGEIRVNVSFDAKSLVFEPTPGQVFWLPDHTTHRAFPSMKCSVAIAAFVPGYSGGTATDSHRLPYSSANDVLTDTHVVAESYRVRLQLQPQKKNRPGGVQLRIERVFRPIVAIAVRD